METGCWIWGQDRLHRKTQQERSWWRVTPANNLPEKSSSLRVLKQSYSPKAQMAVPLCKGGERARCTGEQRISSSTFLRVTMLLELFHFWFWRQWLRHSFKVLNMSSLLCHKYLERGKKGQVLWIQGQPGYHHQFYITERHTVRLSQKTF